MVSVNTNILPLLSSPPPPPQTFLLLLLLLLLLLHHVSTVFVHCGRFETTFSLVLRSAVAHRVLLDQCVRFQSTVLLPPPRARGPPRSLR